MSATVQHIPTTKHRLENDDPISVNQVRISYNTVNISAGLCFVIHDILEIAVLLKVADMGPCKCSLNMLLSLSADLSTVTDHFTGSHHPALFSLCRSDMRNSWKGN